MVSFESLEKSVRDVVNVMVAVGIGGQEIINIISDKTTHILEDEIDICFEEELTETN